MATKLGDKKVLIIIMAVVMIFCMTGCGANGDTDNNNGGDSGQETQNAYNIRPDSQGNNICSFNFGSTKLPDGWVVVEEHNSGGKIYFTRDGEEKASRPDNVAVCTGENPYSADEQTKFNEEVVRDLADGQESESVAVTKGTTRAGDPMYTFTMKFEDGTLVLYYVMGEDEYYLVTLNNFTGETDANAAAKEMAYEFKWK